MPLASEISDFPTSNNLPPTVDSELADLQDDVDMQDEIDVGGESRQKLQSPTNSKLIALILFAFLLTFALARLFVYLILDHLLPNFFLVIRGVHVHHFTYGVIILAVAGLYLLLKRPVAGTSTFRWLAIAYGVGLGLTFDEFGMWVRLKDGYWVRQSYDAVIIVALFLLNAIYYRWLLKVGREMLRIVGLYRKKE